MGVSFACISTHYFAPGTIGGWKMALVPREIELQTLVGYCVGALPEGEDLEE